MNFNRLLTEYENVSNFKYKINKIQFPLITGKYNLTLSLSSTHLKDEVLIKILN